MNRRNRRLGMLLLIAAIPVVGYAIMHLLTYSMALGDENNTGTHALYTVILIAIGLSVPILFLKAGFHRARLRNPAEREFKLADVPKDKDQLARK